ncbi:glycosyltransferase [Patescibacteria group bacterium]|nr:glycosyltransferase [Patescibacteria group bacterium]
MKICLISNLYAPHSRGGAEKVAESMARGLRSAGQDVFVISTKPQFGFKKEILNNIPIYRFKPLNLFYYLNDFKHNAVVRLFWHFIDMFNMHSAFVVNKTLKKEKPDFIITHNLKGIGLLIPLIVKKIKIKHLHILHDVQLSVPSGLIIKGNEKSFVVNGLPTKIYEFLCKKLFDSPESVVSPSQWLMDFYVDKGFFLNSKKTILRNPIDFISHEQTRMRTNKFLFAGQLEKHKGIEWLIDIWQKNNIASELLVAGNGSWSADIKNEKIKFLGKLNQSELNEALAQSDFLILPSLCYENSPTIIPISYANSTPVIAADIGGTAELVDEGKTGFIFTAGDSDSFLNAFSRARSLSPEELTLMKKNSFEKSADYDFKKYIAIILNLLKCN